MKFTRLSDIILEAVNSVQTWSYQKGHCITYQTIKDANVQTSNAVIGKENVTFDEEKNIMVIYSIHIPFSAGTGAATNKSRV